MSSDKRNIFLCQVNHTFGSQAWFPYSVGMIQAYCQSIAEIAANYNFKEFYYLREDPDAVADRMEQPDVLGISCYIWNWEYNQKLASAVKAKHPSCTIVMGGPHVPLNSMGFFNDHAYVDFLVHFEGEIAFSEILLERLKLEPNFEKIEGLSIRRPDQSTHKTEPRSLTYDPSILPSPYLEGVFDELMKQPYDFQASQETHRGCPFSCAFCDWGSATMSKVRQFDDDRLIKEIDWFGKNKIEVLYNCDANYGILKRDHALTVKTAETKRKYGYPKVFRTAFAKNSNDRVFELGAILNEAEMCKGVTLSVQSMDDNTLELIRRKNIKIDNFAELVRKYRAADIPTYTELILGMPGETYETFVEGIDRLIAAGQHDSLSIYVCMILPNSQMGDPEYMTTHGIKTIRVPIHLRYVTPSSNPITEYHDIVIETSEMPLKDWKRAYMFAWAIQCLHGFNLTQHISIFLHHALGVSYREFYQGLLDHMAANPDSLMGREHHAIQEIMDDVIAGGSWDVVIPKFGNVVWPPESASFLNFAVERDTFFAEIEDFLTSFIKSAGLDLGQSLLRDLISYQRHMMLAPGPQGGQIELEFDLHDYIEKCYLDKATECRESKHTLEIVAHKDYGGDLETFAREVVWYGRKGGRFSHANVFKVPAE